MSSLRDVVIQDLTKSSFHPVLLSSQQDTKEQEKFRVLETLHSEGLVVVCDVKISASKSVWCWTPTDKLREMATIMNSSATPSNAQPSAPAVLASKRKLGLSHATSHKAPPVTKEARQHLEILVKKKALLSDLQKKKVMVEKNCTKESLEKLDHLTQKWLAGTKRALTLLDREYKKNKASGHSSSSIGQLIHMMRLDPKMLDFNYDKDDFSGYIEIPDGTFVDPIPPAPQSDAHSSWFSETDEEEQLRKKKQKAMEDDIGLAEY